MRLHGRAWAGVLAGAALAGPAGCGSYEERCDLNPYACPEGAGGGSATSTTPRCGPCEVDDGLGGCEPVRLLADGACPGKDVCAPDLECRKAPGRPCVEGAECATGACDAAAKQCTSCAADADCGDPQAPLCLAGWCRRPPGAACEMDFACITNRCFAGLCVTCEAPADCASGACDDDTHRCLSAPGEPCAAPAECASGQCQAGVCTA